MNGPRLDDSQSREAYDRLNAIILKLVDYARINRLPFQKAWLRVFGEDLGIRNKLDNSSTFFRLFKLSRHYLRPKPTRHLRSFKHVDSAREALGYLGYGRGLDLDKGDPSTWISYL